MARGETILSGVAGRYASALFELARDERAEDAVGADLARFDALVAGSEDLRRLVRSPVFSAEEQGRALAAILDKAGIKGLAGNFLKLVAGKRRLFAVRDMVRHYKALADAAKGISRAEVTLAEPPSETLLAEIRKAVAGAAGGKVEVEVKIDPAIIGGLVVRLGSRMIDTSLKTKLNGIRVAMKEVG